MKYLIILIGLLLGGTGYIAAPSVSSTVQDIIVGTDPRVFTGPQGGTGVGTGVGGDVGKYLKVSGVSPLTYSFDTPAGGSGGAAFPFTPTTWGVSTSTTLGFLQGFLSNASSTISGSTTITGVLTASGGIYGNLTGLASLATALNANGSNCSAGSFPLGVDASGAAESCTDAWTEAENTSAAYLASITVDAPLTGAGTSASHLSIPQATAAADGYLASAVWSIFNNKISSSSLSSANTLLTYNSSTGVFTASSSPTLTNATSSNFFATTASTTNLFGQFINGFGLSTCTGTNALTWTGGSFTCTAQPQGTVTAVSVASANGFAGSSSGGATPALTLSTSITGLLKGNGTAISAAADGTDYTLVTAQDCTGTGHVLAITASGDVTCSADAGGAFPFTPTTNYAALANSTSTPIWFTAGLQASSTSQIAYASTTALSISGTLYVGTDTGLLRTSNGEVFTYPGGSCTNQFIRSLSAIGTPGCATVVATDVSLANLTATDSTLTFSGTYNGSTARTIGLNLGNANTWTGAQIFGNATSTNFFATTASSTNLFASTFGLASTSSAWAGFAIGTTTIQSAGQFAQKIASTTEAATMTINWDSGNFQRIILHQNTTLVINATSSNPRDGGSYKLNICQDSVGARTVTWANGNTLRWYGITPATTTIKTTPLSCTLVGMLYDGLYGKYQVASTSGQAIY